jgi:hypothetical protein
LAKDQLLPPSLEQERDDIRRTFEARKKNLEGKPKRMASTDGSNFLGQYTVTKTGKKEE